MVTFFSIVVMFERQEVTYSTLELVEFAAAPAAARASELPWNADRVTLRGPDAMIESLQPDPLPFDSSGQGDLRIEVPGLLERQIPLVVLPKLEFAELERLRMRQEGFAPELSPDSYLHRRYRDPWAQFGRGIGELSDALKRIGAEEVRSVDLEPQPAPTLVSRPAPGFEAYIEWMADPRDRLVVSAPPIQALWGRDPGELEGPISLLFTVKADGRVVEVLNPVDNELTTSIGIALSKYRFAPLVGSDRNQQGTYRIVAAQGTEQP
jgi:hypothetical protein